MAVLRPRSQSPLWLRVSAKCGIVDHLLDEFKWPDGSLRDESIDPSAVNSGIRVVGESCR